VEQDPPDDLLKARRHRAPEHLLDVMVKRLHEYKRQSLKLLHIVSLYERHLRQDRRRRGRHPAHGRVRREGRPGLQDGQGDHPPDQQGGRRSSTTTRVSRARLKVAFPANYNVTLAEKLIPAADLSSRSRWPARRPPARAT
jgi:starch phosphorylase